MMRIFWPVLFVVAAIGLSVLLVPSRFEFTFMKLRDKDYASAMGDLEARYKSGERARDIVFPLAELYVREGSVDNAIDILSQFSSANPTDKDAKRRLAELLEDAQQLEDRIKTYERVVAASPDPKKLRTLDHLYDLKGDAEGRITALGRLVNEGRATVVEHATLATLLAAKGKKEEALTVLFNAMQRWPGNLPIPMIQTLVALSADVKRADLIDSLLIPWAQKQTSIVAIEAVASSLIDKGLGQDALRLVAQTAALKAGVPDAIVLMARMEDQFGKADAAFARLSALRSKGALPEAADEVYVGLALRLSKPDAAFEHIFARGAGVFNDALLVYAINQAVAQSASGTIDRIKDSLGAAALSERPLIAGQLAFVKGDLDDAVAQAGRARDLAKTPRAKLLLADLYAALKVLEPARELLLETTAAPENLTTEELSLAIPVAVAVKEAPLALQMAELYRAREKGPLATIHYARALVVNDRGEEALKLLEDLNSPLDIAEVAVFEALRAMGRLDDLQSRLYARLADDKAPDAKRTNYIFLLNDLKHPHDDKADAVIPGLVEDLGEDTISGIGRDARIDLLAAIDPATALPFVKERAEDDVDKYGYVYLDLLKKSKLTGERHRFLKFGVENAKSEKVQDDYLFELIKTGVTADILPWIKDRAESGKEPWFYAYDSALAKLGMSETRIGFLKSYARRDGLKVELKRQIAFQLLELGHRPEAEALFIELAEDAPVKAPDTRQLLYLWGPRPEPEAKAWIARRAQSAEGTEIAGWVEALVNTDNPELAVTLGSKAYDGGDRDVALPYAQALVLLKKDSDLAGLLTLEAASPGDAKRTLAFAQAGESRGLNATASRLFEAAANAGDRTALEAAARTAFYAGERDRARQLTARAIAEAKETVELRYIEGELARLAKAHNAAKTAFESAVILAAKDGRRTAQRLAMLAHARLDALPQALKVLARLSDPVADDDATADLAGTLIDQGDMTDAGRLLGYD